MRKSVLDSPPFTFVARHLAQDTDFLDDARHLIDLDEDAYLRLATHLAMTDIFLSRSELERIVGEILGEGEQSDQIASIVSSISGFIHDADMDAMDAMDVLGRAIEENAGGLEPQDRRKLTERLRKLAAEPIGIAKQYKAQQLVDATGAELDDFRILCDIRPIFDRERDRIEGAIPLSILRLEFTKADGESAVAEVRVTEKQIVEFGKKIADANLKLRMIKQLLMDQHLPIPTTKSTIAEDET